MEEHLEDFDEIEPLPQIDFEIGDSVVYPHHGAGKVLRKEMKEVLGCSREYLTIKILHNDMTVMVPTENAALAGLRRVIDEETVQKVLAVLKDECSEMPKNWNRRFKHNRDKIKTGDIYELAEVVRNLAIRELQKGLSTGEKQMFTRAKKILSSELMYALAMNEDEVEDHLTEVLESSSGNHVASAPPSSIGDDADGADDEHHTAASRAASDEPVEEELDELGEPADDEAAPLAIAAD